MTSTVTHAIVPLAVAVALGPQRISPKLAVAGAFMAIVPDFDVIGFWFGIEYGDDWGHRGASHSFLFAFLGAGVVSLLWREARSITGFLFLALAIASNGLLDAVTNGGLGVALLWPMDNARIFAPYTPVRVSPIGLDFFSERGLVTLWSEMKWVWLPCLALALGGWGLRRAARPRP
ncbi:metal-dependent hydrolase [Parasphingopyxis sp.]|uniref:metal-dependent hydrolase n=1 Tax=Parasphingopyxis sp. TaxID=1920299 RepID=UPI0026203000|nr:metal-dependent hydrolase [Parasphingopyxis sp.]